MNHPMYVTVMPIYIIPYSLFFCFHTYNLQSFNYNFSINQVTEGVALNTACRTEVDKSVAAPTSDEPNVVHENSSKTLQHCHLTKHSKDIDSRDGAHPDNSLSLKAVKSVTEPHSATKKKGKRSSSLMNPEEKSEIEPYPAPKKRGRKPNSLMNPEEGYENYWMHSGKKSPKSAGNKKSHGKGSNSLPTEDRLCGKVTLSSTLPSTLQTVTEPPSSQPETEGDIGSASSFLHNSHRDEFQSRRGRPKKQVAVAHQEANPTSLSAAKGDISIAQAEEKTLQSIDINLNMESKETSALKEKSRGRPRKFRAKTNDETVIASVHVGTEKVSAVPCDSEEKPQEQSALNLGTGNINDQSAVKKVGTGNVSEAKQRGHPRKLAAKINQETILASEHAVVTEKESPVPCDPEEKPQQESALQHATRSMNDQSAIKRIKKRRRDDTSSKDSTEGSRSKVLD